MARGLACLIGAVVAGGRLDASCHVHRSPGHGERFRANPRGAQPDVGRTSQPVLRVLGGVVSTTADTAQHPSVATQHAVTRARPVGRPEAAPLAAARRLLRRCTTGRAGVVSTGTGLDRSQSPRDDRSVRTAATARRRDRSGRDGRRATADASSPPCPASAPCLGSPALPGLPARRVALLCFRAASHRAACRQPRPHSAAPSALAGPATAPLPAERRGVLGLRRAVEAGRRPGQTPPVGTARGSRCRPAGPVDRCWARCDLPLTGSGSAPSCLRRFGRQHVADWPGPRPAPALALRTRWRAIGRARRGPDARRIDAACDRAPARPDWARPATFAGAAPSGIRRSPSPVRRTE